MRCEVVAGGRSVCNPLLLAAAAVYQADSFGDFLVPDVAPAHQHNNSKMTLTGMKANKTTGDVCKQFQCQVTTHSSSAAL